MVQSQKDQELVRQIKWSDYLYFTFIVIHSIIYLKAYFPTYDTM